MTITDTTTADSTTSRPFETLMAVEGRWTGDERIIMVDGLRWDGLLPMCLTIDHEGVQQIVGRVDEIARTPGGSADERFIFGKGEMFLGSDLGKQVEQLIDGKFLRGVSIELDDITQGGIDPNDPAIEPGDDPMWMQVTETARLRALSVVTTPAFAEAYITFGSLNTDGLPPAIDGPTPLPADQVPDVEEPEEIIIVAAGHTITIPSLPPAEWFAEPTDVSIAGALTVTDDGRVYGLLAPANTTFLGNPAVRGVPMGNVDYSRFMRGEAIVEGGERVVAGSITMGCGHTPLHADVDPMAARAAMMSHHDNTCSVVAQVAVGERFSDPAGVWVAGALLPGVTADQVQRMMACQLSGEWNGLPGGRYELLASLLVPVPAFAMGRRVASVTSRYGQLVASAIPVQFEDCGCSGTIRAAACSCKCCSHTGSASADVDALAARVGALESALRPTVMASLAADMQSAS